MDDDRPKFTGTYHYLEGRIDRFKRQKFMLLAGLVLGIVILAVMGLFYQNGATDTPVTPPQPGLIMKGPARPEQFTDELEQAAVTDLRGWGRWLVENNARGYVGEFGWTAAADSEAWNRLADAWYREAWYHDVWATAWAAGSWWGDYPLAIYTHVPAPDDPPADPAKPAAARTLNTARAQSAVVERYPSADGRLRGINLAGMEFGTDVPGTYHNGAPGAAGTDYFYEPEATFAYLKSRKVGLVRLPIRWERIQPTLGGPLNAAEMAGITAMLDAADKHGIKVILNLHNYGVYKMADGDKPLGTDVPHAQLADVWVKLSGHLGGHRAVAAYGLMNEPHDLPAGAYGSPARNWEIASQTVVSALRGAGDRTLVMVAGYDWSSLVRWQQNHPKAWINDPENNVRYEAHHYWDETGAGTYPMPYAAEVQRAREGRR